MNDLFILVAVVANFMFGSSFFYCTPHLEGEEVFGSTKQHANCPLDANNDFHRPNHVNFSHP